MRILLQDEWYEDSKDILESGEEIVIIEKSDIKLMSKENFFCYDVVFCDTDLFQEKLDGYPIPDTYDVNFTELFKRKIEKSTIDKFKKTTEPKFIKPIGNNKSFTGIVINPENFDTDFTNRGLEIPVNQEIYIVDPLKIISEYRLLIGNGKILGSGHILGTSGNWEIHTKFINDILIASNNRFLCVDIAQILDTSFKWIVLEINPPFSLDDHVESPGGGIPFNQYFAYCIESFQNIKLQQLEGKLSIK